MKRFLVVLMALVLALGMMTVSAFAADDNEGAFLDASLISPTDAIAVTALPAVKFVDVPEGSWFEAAVEWAVANQITAGIDSAHFAPDMECTRAQLVTFLYRAEGEPPVLDMTEQGSYFDLHGFSDVAKADWFYDAVKWASANGIVNGVNDTTFAPDAKVTREQIAAIIYRLQVSKGADVSVADDTNILDYDDAQSISQYAVVPFQYAAGSGIITGIADGSKMLLAPQASATRAQIVTILYRLSQLEPAPATDPIVGEYTDKASGRATMEITAREEEGVYDIIVHHSDSYAVFYQWEMTATLQGNKLVYTEGVEKKFTYVEEMQDFHDDVIKIGLAGSMEITDAAILWQLVEGEYTTDYEFLKVGKLIG